MECFYYVCPHCCWDHQFPCWPVMRLASSASWREISSSCDCCCENCCSKWICRAINSSFCIHRPSISSRILANSALALSKSDFWNIKKKNVEKSSIEVFYAFHCYVKTGIVSNVVCCDFDHWKQKQVDDSKSEEHKRPSLLKLMGSHLEIRVEQRWNGHSIPTIHLDDFVQLCGRWKMLCFVNIFVRWNSSSYFSYFFKSKILMKTAHCRSLQEFDGYYQLHATVEVDIFLVFFFSGELLDGISAKMLSVSTRRLVC